MPIVDRVRSAWNAFRSSDQTVVTSGGDYGLGPPVYVSSSSPSRPTGRSPFSERTIVTSIYNRISIDVSGIVLMHIETDEYGRYKGLVKNRLNSCLSVEPNLDQGPRSFRQDIAQTLFEKGVAAIVPVDTLRDEQTEEIIDIFSMRVGEIVQWYPQHIKANVYNEAKGKREEIYIEKKMAAIVENPLYLVMNEPNGTLQRLIRKLALLDAVDEQSSSGKLDLLIQLPYVVKSEARKQQAEARRKDIEFQLKGSQYGIAYIDGTEKVTQLNRPAENQLLDQIKYLTEMLYGQLGITPEVMNGTANEATMINYYNRTVEPIADAIVEAMQRKFIGQKAMESKEKIFYFRDPFKFLPLSQIAEIVDKFTRNEVASSNEMRGKIGLPPSPDPKADQLINSNMPTSDTGVAPTPSASPAGPSLDDLDSIMNQVFDGLGQDISSIASG